MRQRVFFKILAAMVLVVLAAAAMLDISQQNILESSLQNQRVHSLANSAQALAQRVVNPAANLGLLAQEEARAIDGRVTIVKNDGSVIADYAAGGGDMGATAASTLSLNSSDMRAITVQHRAYGRGVNQGTLYVTAPAGNYIVRLGYPNA